MCFWVRKKEIIQQIRITLQQRIKRENKRKNKVSCFGLNSVISVLIEISKRGGIYHSKEGCSTKERKDIASLFWVCTYLAHLR